MLGRGRMNEKLRTPVVSGSEIPCMATQRSLRANASTAWFAKLKDRRERIW